MKQLHRKALLALVAFILLNQAGCKRSPAEEEQKTVTEVAVQVGKITRATLRARIEAFGTVEPEPAGGDKPAGAGRLAAPVTGLVTSVPAKEGDHVEPGAVIVRLDDRLALSSLALAEQQFERQKKLRTVEGTSEKLFQEASQQLAAAKTQLAFLQITTPIAGVVAKVNVQPGQAVDMNTVVAEVVDLGRLVVTVNVPSQDIVGLKAGQPAEFFVGNADKPAATGKVIFLSPQIDSKTGSGLVRLSLAPNNGLRPGQLVRVRIVSEERDGRLAAPVESVVKEGDQSVVAVVDGDKATQKPVKIGIRDGDLIEVEGEGLKEGDTVVTVGAYGLPKETKVKILPR